jgi:hypothetical protein
MNLERELVLIGESIENLIFFEPTWTVIRNRPRLYRLHLHIFRFDLTGGNYQQEECHLCHYSPSVTQPHYYCEQSSSFPFPTAKVVRLHHIKLAEWPMPVADWETQIASLDTVDECKSKG